MSFELGAAAGWLLVHVPTKKGGKACNIIYVGTWGHITEHMGGIGDAHNQSGTNGDARRVGKRGLTKGRRSRSVKQCELQA